MRYLRVGLALCVALGSFVFVMAGPASAHVATVTGTVSCTTSGAFQITWLITNDYPSNMTADVSSPSGGVFPLSVLVGPGAPPPNLASKTVTQTLPVSAAGQIVTLNVTVTWADLPDEPEQLSATVTLPEPCPQPPPNVEVGGTSVSAAADPVRASLPFTG